jgi:hypothetical protein
MTPDSWSDIMARITPRDAVALDAPVFGQAQVQNPAAWPAAVPGDAAPPPLARALCPAGDGSVARIGIRLRVAPTDPAGLAARLAAAAVERSVVPVILSRLNASGLERFGFAVERIAAPTEAAARAQEADLARLWGLAIIVEATDVDADPPS